MEQCETCRHPVSLTCTYCRECGELLEGHQGQVRSGRGSDAIPVDDGRRGRGARRQSGRRGAEGPVCP